MDAVNNSKPISILLITCIYHGGLSWHFAGTVLNTLMFLTVSIPLADKRQSEKPGYAKYRAGTRSLLPIPKR